jgi:6,7-dimethyl-8-ribityllumazine synthase
MSGEGAPTDVPAAGGLRLGVVAARWHADIIDGLLAGALAAAKDAGVEGEPTVARVAGAVELPVVTAALAAGHDAVVALGVVIRGGTPHFEYVCQFVTSGLARVTLDTGVPVGFGVLTCDTADQARARAGLPGSAGDKGREAALAALDCAVVLRDLRRPGGPTDIAG